MSNLAAPIATQPFVLRDISWSTYESLIRDLEEQHLQLTYNDGTLEIMSRSPAHEKIGKFVARLVETLTLELAIPIVALGRTTWRRESITKGLEADECYYIARAEWAVSREEFDLEVDPAPDLAIEVDVTNSTIDKLEIYAALGVPEVWRFDEEQLQILSLAPTKRYDRAEQSRFLPMLPSEVVQRFVGRRNSLNDTALMLEFRDWVRANCP